MLNLSPNPPPKCLLCNGTGMSVSNKVPILQECERCAGTGVERGYGCLLLYFCVTIIAWVIFALWIFDFFGG